MIADEARASDGTSLTEADRTNRWFVAIDRTRQDQVIEARSGEARVLAPLARRRQTDELRGCAQR